MIASSVLGKTSALAAVVILAISTDLVAKEAADMPSSNPILTLGDPAPSLASARVIKGSPIRQFDPGKTYVVEFWATWCGPCKEAMPHLSALARKYQGQVTFVSVNIQEKTGSEVSTDALAVEKVERFVRESGDLMGNVLMDDEVGTIETHWDKAARQVGIPTTYIVVDKKLVWIGRPTQLEEPLAQVVAGTYTAPIEAFKQQQADNEDADRLLNYPPLREASRINDYATQARIFEVAAVVNPRLENRFAMEFFRVLQHLDSVRAWSYARGYIDRNMPLEKDPQRHSEALGTFARIVLREKSLQNPDLDSVLEFAQESLDIAPEKSGANYSLLASAFVAKQNFARAIELQEQAISLAKKIPDSNPEKQTTLARYTSTLANYRAAAAKKATKDETS